MLFHTWRLSKNVQIIYIFACMLSLCCKHCRDLIVADACSNYCSLRFMYLNISLAKHRCCLTHAECSINVQNVYIFICMLCLVSYTLQGWDCGGCMFQSLFTPFHISGHRFSQPQVLSDTCRVLNKCVDCVYIHMHAVPCVASIAGIGLWRMHAPIIAHSVPCIRTSI